MAKAKTPTAKKPPRRSPEADARRRETSVQVGLRIKSDLREALMQAAANQGVSMNEEAAGRIQQSFIDEKKLFKDQSLMALIQLLVGTIRLIEVRTGEYWVSDERTRNAVAATVVSFLTGERGVPFHKPPQVDEDGTPLNEDPYLHEGNRTALWDAMWALLKTHGASDQTIEMIERLIKTDEGRRRSGGSAGLIPED